MVKRHDEQLNRIFGALSDPTRRAILERLAQGERCVGELVEPLSISGPAVSRHLRVLERAGLLERTKTGRMRVCKFQPQPLDNATAWIEKHRAFWDDKFDALTRYFEQTDEKKSKERMP